MQINHGGFGGKRHRSGSGGTNAFMEVEEVGGGSGGGRSDGVRSVMVEVM